MTYEPVPFTQAVRAKYARMTFERKSMSTKTSIKRIALVAVSALGLGVLTSVAPASAAITTGTAVGDTTLTTVLPTTRPGVAGVYTIGFKAATGNNDSSTVIVRAAMTKPAGSAATVTLANNTASNDAFEESGVISGSGTAALTYTLDGSNSAITAAAGTLQVDATVNPDVVGTYSIMYYADLNNNSAIDSGEAYYSQSLSVVADAPVLALKVWGSTTIAEAAANDKGALIRVSLTNGGAATTLSGTEVLNLSGITTFAVGGNTSKTTISRGDFDKNGYAWIQAATATAGTYTLSVQGVGGGVGALLQTTTITVKDATGEAASQEITSFAKTNTTGVGTDSDNDTIKYLGTTTITYKATGATTAGATTYEADDVLIVRIADTDGLITGVAGLGYVSALTLGSTATATIDVTFASASTLGSAPTAGSPDTVGTVTLDDTTDNVKTVRTALSLVKSFTVSPNTTIRAKTGAKIEATALVKDQFGIAAANKAVTATLASGSRNSGVVVVQNLVTDASGYVSYSYTDAPLAANAALTTDTWAIAVAAGDQAAAADGGAYAAGALTVNFVTTLGVSKVVLTGGNTSAGVEATTITNNAIDAGADGASATTQAYSAKVTDASGSVLVGVPVTFTVSGTGAAIPSNKVTVYTDSTGVATSAVYAWVAGKYTVTGTAEGVSAKGTISFAQETAASARSISATTSGAIATALVKDRYGNPVKGVTVYATKTGTGYFGNGLSKTSGTTDAAGEVEFNITGGAATVTVSVVDPAAAAGTTFGQTCAAKGYADCATTATAFTASAAGTALKAETGVGASYDAAGISSATVEVSATGSSDAIDAANEATEAANAATDAANAAAEAADAATAAAQDAQAAVADLAAQVSSLIASIKSQLTSLTNLIIKIQKKVKA
jgi:hypothetical protein